MCGVCAHVTFRDGVGALSYQVLDCPDKAALVQVDDKGHLSSGSLTGTASLQVNSQESFGVNQTLILAVKVPAHLSFSPLFPSPLLLFFPTLLFSVLLLSSLLSPPLLPYRHRNTHATGQEIYVQNLIYVAVRTRHRGVEINVLHLI